MSCRECGQPRSYLPHTRARVCADYMAGLGRACANPAEHHRYWPRLPGELYAVLASYAAVLAAFTCRGALPLALAIVAGQLALGGIIIGLAVIVDRAAGR